FLLIIDNKKLSKVLNILNRKLKRLSLELNQDKTSIIDLESSFEYLGYVIKKDKISVRRTSIESQIKKIAYHFKHKTPVIDESDIVNRKNKKVFIEDLNELITGAISEDKRYGWLFYYSQITDTKLLYILDRIVEKFFMRSDFFNRQVHPDRKSYVKAYYLMCQPDVKTNNYFHNYANYDTKSKQIEYLIARNLIDPETANDLNAEEIKIKFVENREKKLKNLERDVHKNKS
ncbi:MAG: hypothetical protein JXQ65_03490, partial [Candidatus Marinimicrobia bacterium]|nr:hypothetical protein [Candidatus Neomarinimicrobiota bacterium]